MNKPPPLYFAIVHAKDDNTMPTEPDPRPLAQMSNHLIEWLVRYQVQGYYSNCKQERVPLDQISFTIISESEFLR